MVLRDLFAMLPAGVVSAYFPVPQPQGAQLIDELSEITAIFAPVRHERAIPSRLGLPGRAFASVLNQVAFRTHVCRLVREAVALGQRHRAEAVWAILDAPTSIAMAAPVARALGKPLLGLVWDDFTHISASLCLDRLSANAIQRHAACALRSAERCAVMGDAMKNRYLLKYGTNSIILRQGLVREQLHPVRDCGNREPVFSLGFAGSMTAPCAFNAMLAALESCDWQIAGRSIELRLLGPRFDIRSNKPALFHYYGYGLSVSETIAILAGCDVTYLPQPFAEERRNLAELSFPTKLTTYLATGRPILLHSPNYASLPQYHKQQPLGVHCGSTEPQAIVTCIKRLICEPGLYARAAADARQAYRRDFTEERFRGSFAELLGTTPASFSGGSA